MSHPLSGAPQRVRVRNGQVLADTDSHISSPDQQTAVPRKRLRAIGHAAVLEHGARIVNGHVWWIRQGHLVAVHLDNATHPKDLIHRILERIQLKEPIQIVGYPDLVRLVLGPATTTGTMGLQFGQFGPNVWVTMLLI